MCFHTQEMDPTPKAGYGPDRQSPGGHSPPPTQWWWVSGKIAQFLMAMSTSEYVPLLPSAGFARVPPPAAPEAHTRIMAKVVVNLQEPLLPEPCAPDLPEAGIPVCFGSQKHCPRRFTSSLVITSTHLVRLRVMPVDTACHNPRKTGYIWCEQAACIQSFFVLSHRLCGG